VAWVTLDRPPLNVLDLPMIQALDNALRAVIVQSDLLVFQGAGPKGFSAGVEVRDHTPERVRETLGAFHGIFRQLWQAECLTVAAVHGYCLGGGCELASFCDFVIATESAQFGQPEIKLGCFPPVALVTLPSLVGARAAADLILTGRTISAREAHEMGLVTRVVADDALASAVDALLSELGALSPAVLRISRQALRQRIGMNFEDGLRQVEHIYLDQLIKTEDASEGIYAFLEKRQPVWRGC
jgi:cyclohexa-1,5-dienecarbonyl-CoA hydratase